MIQRSKHSQNFTVLPNKIFKDLTDGLAIGLLSYLLSKPENWNVTKQQLYKHFNEGRQRLDKSFSLLEDAGYIVGEQQKDSNSKFIGFHWIVSDIPDTMLNSVFQDNRLTETQQPTKGQPKIKQVISNIKVNTIVNKDSKEQTYLFSHPLCDWLVKECPNVQKMKQPINSDQAIKLLKDFDRKQLVEIFEAMDNKPDLKKKYNSASRTVRSWIKLRQQSDSSFGIIKKNDSDDTYIPTVNQ